MGGKIGDEILIDGRHINDLPRRGKIVDVMTSDGREHYRVRWHDGSDSLFFPGSDAHIVHQKSSSKP